MSGEPFNLESLLEDTTTGKVKGFDFFIDPAHGGKDAHIDLHVFLPEVGGVKYTNLSGVEELRAQLTYLQDGQHREHTHFGFKS
jgi:hypothetical protein